jgi:hypothetical protein
MSHENSYQYVYRLLADTNIRHCKTIKAVDKNTKVLYSYYWVKVFDKIGTYLPGKAASYVSIKKYKSHR